jgi:hypothetical protein
MNIHINPHRGQWFQIRRIKGAEIQCVNLNHKFMLSDHINVYLCATIPSKQFVAKIDANLWYHKMTSYHQTPIRIDQNRAHSLPYHPKRFSSASVLHSASGTINLRSCMEMSEKVIYPAIPSESLSYQDPPT